MILIEEIRAVWGLERELGGSEKKKNQLKGRGRSSDFLGGFETHLVVLTLDR